MCALHRSKKPMFSQTWINGPNLEKSCRVHHALPAILQHMGTCSKSELKIGTLPCLNRPTQGWEIIFARGPLWEVRIQRMATPSSGSRSQYRFITSCTNIYYENNDSGSSFAAGCMRNLLPGSAPISLQWFSLYLSFKNICKTTTVTHTKRIDRNLLRKETSFMCYTSSVLRKSRHMKQKGKNTHCCSD